ncbi:hypothetical protein OAO80_01740 [Gammaproteobacteria bacterium]|nr:hypothetical protein [Gammaproteobacteria bacterium]
MSNKFFVIISFIILSGCSESNSNQINLSTVISPEYSSYVTIANCNLLEGNSLINLESFLSSQTIQKKGSKLSLSVLFPDSSSYVNTFLIYAEANLENEASKSINNIYLNGLDALASCEYEKPYKSTNLFKNISTLTEESDYDITEILNCSYNDGFNYGSFVIAIDRLIQKMEMFKSKYEIDYIELADSKSFIWINRFDNSFFKEELPEIWLSNPLESTEIQNEFKDNAICYDATVYKEFSL